MTSATTLASACAQVGLAFRHDHDRSRPSHDLALDHDTAPPALCLIEGAGSGLDVLVVDLDPAHPGLLVELATRAVQREPSFDLWLEEVDRRRFLVFARDGAWQLTVVGRSHATVADALAAHDS
jgi:hypothetical protein